MPSPPLQAGFPRRRLENSGFWQPMERRGRSDFRMSRPSLKLGYKVVHNSPIGIVGPKDLPKDIVKILHDAFKKSLDDPTFLSVMDRYEMPVMYLNTQDFTK